MPRKSKRNVAAVRWVNRQPKQRGQAEGLASLLAQVPPGRCKTLQQWL